MRPKINRQKFLEVNDSTLVQIIAESNQFNDDNLISDSEKVLISKRLEICELINRIEFTIESYGMINFLIDYEDEIIDLKRLAELLKEFGEFDISESTKTTLEFYTRNKIKFDYLKTNPDDYSEKHNELEKEYFALGKPKTGFYFSIPLHKGIEKLANKIRSNPDEYCLDENGESLISC